MSADDGASVDNIGDRRYASGYSTGHAEGMEEVLRMMTKVCDFTKALEISCVHGDLLWRLSHADSEEFLMGGYTSKSLIDYLNQEYSK